MPHAREVYGTMIELDVHTFPIVVAHGRVLVSWYRSGWEPWRAFAPIYQAAAICHPRVVFARIDAQREQALAVRCGIEALPTLMAFSGGALVFVHVGFDIAESLDAVVRRLLSYSASPRSMTEGISPVAAARLGHVD